MKNKKFFIITSVIMILCICIAFTMRQFQNDTFYTIKIGESISKRGIDMIDHFSYHKLDYTYPHWLYDLIIYKIYHNFGFKGLYLNTMITFIILGLLTFFINIKLNKSYFTSLFFSILGIIMVANFASARAQLVSYVLFLLEIYFIERILSSSKKIYGICLIIIAILIANFHAAVWPFYFIIMLPYIVEYIISLIKKNKNNKELEKIFMNRLIIEKNDNMKFILIIFLVSILTGLLTPIGTTPYTYFIKILMGDTQKYIYEHKPLVLIENYFVMEYLFFILVPLIFTKVKIKLTDFLMLGGLLFMAFLSLRHVALLSVVGTFYLIRLICNIGKINGKKPLDLDLPKFGNVFLLISIIIISIIVYNINSNKEYINKDIYPVDMVDYIYKELDTKKIKLYNDYDFGSYLMYRKLPVFIDSRSDLYTKPFNHKTDIFDECMNITKHYGRIFKKYDITHILIYKDTELNQILTASNNYNLVKKDGNFALFEYIPNTKEKND